MKRLLSIVPSNRFYYAALGCAGLLLLAFPFRILFVPAQIGLAGLIALSAADLLFLFSTGIRIEVARIVPRVLSLGNPTDVSLLILNVSGIHLHAEVIDELPFQLQRRDFALNVKLPPREKVKVTYTIRPVLRGVYMFGSVQLSVSSRLGLLTRRVTVENPFETAVYPSIAEMQKFELSTFSQVTTPGGIRKIRRIGHSYEFDQIRNYVSGDEYRSINWKATGRKGDLMINQFEDERSQQVYCVLDVSRSMQLPFNGLSLLDYAINTSLVIANIALRKHDKAGLVYYSGKQTVIIPAERSRPQLRRILDTLYNLHTLVQEPDVELLYSRVRSKITQRSLLFLFTNFESQYALERVLPVLRRLNRIHLLVVVFFENEEISELSQADSHDLQGVYLQTVAQKFITTKLQLVQLLKQHGIQSIYTKPEDLSMNTVNKYLELKSRGLI